MKYEMYEKCGIEMYATTILKRMHVNMQNLNVHAMSSQKLHLQIIEQRHSQLEQNVNVVSNINDYLHHILHIHAPADHRAAPQPA